MFTKQLSFVSMFIGLLTSIAAIALLWPVDGNGPVIALIAFVLGGGSCELVRRALRRSAPSPSKGGSGEA